MVSSNAARANTVLGFPDESRLVAVARPYIVALTEQVSWPFSIATQAGDVMMVAIRHTAITSLARANYALGYTPPITECSTGKAYLAYCSDEEQRTIRKGMGMLESPANRAGTMLFDNGKLFAELPGKGYATQARNTYTSNSGKNSSIAVPILQRQEIIGALAIIFFSAGISRPERERRSYPASAAREGDARAACDAIEEIVNT